MSNSISRYGNFWSRASSGLFRQFFLTPVKNEENVHFLFFSGYLGPNHYHLYQIVQLVELQKLNPKNVFLHIVLMDVGLHTRRHTDYSAIETRDDRHENEIHLAQIRGVLRSLGVNEKNIRTYFFSDVLVQAFNKRKDLIIDFYRGLSEIPNVILHISDLQLKKFNIPKGKDYTIGYVIQKYGILFLSTHFEQIFQNEMIGGRVIPVFGDSGRPIIEQLEICLRAQEIIIPMRFALNLDAIPTFGTDKAKTTALSIPTAGMSTLSIARIIHAYGIRKEEMREIYAKFITPVLQRKWKNGITCDILSQDLHDTLQKLVAQPIEPVELIVQDAEGMARLGSLLRRSSVHEILNLCNGNRTVTEISREIGKHTSNVSATIHQLRKEGIIEFTTSGRPKRMRRAIKFILQYREEI
jgi:hypothetical protein